MFRSPVVAGGGTPFLPPVADDVPLDLIEARTFDARVIYERYGRAPRGLGLTPPLLVDAPRHRGALGPRA